MRIARIIEYFPPHVGGMERHGLILTQEQIKLGHEIDVYIGYGGKNANKLNAIANDANCELNISNSQHSHNIRRFALYRAPFQWLPLYSKARRLWFNVWAYFAVKKNHKKNPYNIIHAHGDFVEAFFGGKLAKKLGIPAVLTIHAGLNKKLLKQKNAKYFSNIDKIICVSDEIKQDLKAIGIAGDKLEVVSSGIYLKDFENKNQEEIQKISEHYSRPIIISVGVLRPAKGFKYLIEAFKKIKEKFGGANLIIIGGGPDKTELENQAKDIPGIYFLGRQDHGRVIEHLKAANVFVLASIYMEGDREGTSNSIMDAMAAGLPIVATKVGGTPYLVKEGINGFLVEDKNGDELAKAMIKLIDNPEICEKMKIKNLEDIKRKDWPEIAKQITNIYLN